MGDYRGVIFFWPPFFLRGDYSSVNILLLRRFLFSGKHPLNLVSNSSFNEYSHTSPPIVETTLQVK